jgi:hypothetical protein
MSNAPAISPSRRSRPRLKVVRSDLDTPSRVIAFRANDLRAHAVEHWSQAEWDQLHPAERPRDAAFLPGCGWLTVRDVTMDEGMEIGRLYTEALDRWEMVTGSSAPGR